MIGVTFAAGNLPIDPGASALLKLTTLGGELLVQRVEPVLALVRQLFALIR